MRLIDADKLKGKAFADPDDGEHFVYCQDIDEAPTVDAVPVVRCRDCEHIYIDGYGYLICVKSGLYSDENDYCSRGQRRDQSADARNLGQFAGGGKTGGPNDADQH